MKTEIFTITLFGGAAYKVTRQTKEIKNPRVLTFEQIFRNIPKKYHHMINKTSFDVDTGGDKPLYFLSLIPPFELEQEGFGLLTFYTIAELREHLRRIVMVKE